jgi:hypothetical protein
VRTKPALVTSIVNVAAAAWCRSSPLATATV